MQPCVYCETAMPDHARYCGHCGQKMETPPVSDDDIPQLPDKASEHDSPPTISTPEQEMLDDARTELMLDDPTSDDAHTEPVLDDNPPDDAHTEPVLDDDIPDDAHTEPVLDDNAPDDAHTEPTLDDNAPDDAHTEPVRDDDTSDDAHTELMLDDDIPADAHTELMLDNYIPNDAYTELFLNDHRLADAPTRLIVGYPTPDNARTELFPDDYLAEIEQADTFLIPLVSPFPSEPDNLPTLVRGSINNNGEKYSEYFTEGMITGDLEEDEQERRRRAMLLGGIVLDDLSTLPASGPQAGSASVLYGTPQPGDAAFLQGTPQPGNAPALYSTPQPGNAAFLQGTPQMGVDPSQGILHNQALMNTGNPYQRFRAGRQTYAQHFASQPASLQSYPPFGQTGIAKKLTHHTSRWLLIVAVAVIVIASAGIGAALAISPVLSASGLSGNNVVPLGSVLHLHGKGFFPSGHITLQRENGQPLSPQSSTTSTDAGQPIA
ncbi:MAG TPA: hypothetical protein VGN34_04360, partial [Ktedonobacteraceae bacterium]